MSLISFTAQGLAEVGRSPQRADEFRAKVEAAGGRVISMYWSLGKHDGCLVFEAPNEQTGASLILGLTKLGNVKTESTNVFTAEEFSALAGGD